MRLLVILTALFFCVNLLPGQSLWNTAPESDDLLRQNLTTYHLSVPNLEQLKATLIAAPKEFDNTKKEAISVDFPMPDGAMTRFQIEETATMESELAARYPHLKSYKGTASDKSGTQIRVSVSGEQIKVIMASSSGLIRIEPIEAGSDTYISYYLRESFANVEAPGNFACGVDEIDHLEYLETKIRQSVGREKSSVELVPLRTYRLALASTYTFAPFAGRTVPAILATFNDIVNTLNIVFEREASIRLILINETDNLIFTDQASDPFNLPAEPDRLSSQAPMVFASRISVDAYDIGHTMTGRSSSGLLGTAGAIGTVCNAQTKGAGVTSYSNSVNYTVTNTLMHEVGHQFGGLHTWNRCGSNDQFQAGNDYEPLSGTTIMSYAGVCGPDNIQNTVDQYFHIGSLERIMEFSRTGNGNTCAQVIPTENNSPEVEITGIEGLYIPVRTPFELEATGSDVDNDDITYCWEQFDTGTIFDSETSTVLPKSSFRSFPPTTSPIRMFPNRQTVLSGNSNRTEVLPIFSRDFTFRCTVRDNKSGGGAATWEEVSFESDVSAGPFLVSYPTVTTDTLRTGQQVEVLWDVANTTNPRVNCQRVNILLSTNGGSSFPITLLSNTQNDGSEVVTIPDVLTAAARIRVEAANNIFFNVSRNNFPIVAADAPAIAIRPEPFFQQVCLPNTATVELTTEAIAGFEGNLNFEVQGLPEGASVTFEPANVAAGESTSVTIDLSNTSTNALETYQIVASSDDGTVTVSQDVEFDVISNDFSALQLMSPMSGTSGIVGIANFEWTALPNAIDYDLELASSPAFRADDIVLRVSGITTNSLLPEDIFLPESSLFYWRVRPNNECGAGDYTVPNVFKTISVQCVPFGQDEPVDIPGVGTPTVQSIINIPSSGTITDLNVPLITATYPPLGFTEISLISPAETKVVLFSRQCGNVRDFASGFDDEAPTEVACPPNTGIVHIPREPLAAFDGEDIQGDWTLEFRVITAGFGAGTLANWQLESCANIEVAGPLLVVNEVFDVPPASRSQIWTTTLEAEDVDNPTDEIIYEMLSAPQHGTLYLEETPLAMGDSFTQQDIDGYRISYEHNGNDATEDGFDFLIRDTNNGFYGPDEFRIVIDENATVGTNDPSLGQEIRIYPNPASERLNIELSENLVQNTQVRMFNVSGQQVRFVATSASSILEINTSDLASGIYFIQIYSNNTFYTERVVIE